MVEQKSIFISIASFCDPYMVFTVQHAIAMATYPDRLHFGIVDQNTFSVESQWPRIHPNISYLTIDAHHSRGACWARSLAMTLYDGQDYFLQLDAHMAFDEGWDVGLIENLERISTETGNRDTIISVRPFAFLFDGAGQIEKVRVSENTLCFRPEKTEIDLKDPIILFSAYYENTKKDVQGYQVSAAFLFTRGHFVNAIPYDPFLYFHGEEQSIAVRAITHGWDIWQTNYGPIYHFYRDREEHKVVLHWSDDFEARRKVKWFERKALADIRLGKLLAGEDLGVYGLGKKRGLDHYLQLAKMTIKTPEANRPEAK